MNFFKGRLRNLSLAIIVLLVTSACGIFSSDSESGNVEVKMHDNPALYQEVNVTIEKVQVRNSGEGWVTISSGPTTVDVTTLINGKFATLADANLESGSYTQMRLIFGTDNSLRMSGDNFDLKLSSEAEEGVVININLNVDAESSATLLLDFNLQKSIIQSALDFGGSIILNPVIEVRKAKQTGKVEGEIDPAEAKPWIHAMQGSDTVSSTLADTSSGEFMLAGLKEDTYDINIEPTDSLYIDTTITDVQVEARETKNLGTIELEVDSSGGNFHPTY